MAKIHRLCTSVVTGIIAVGCCCYQQFGHVAIESLLTFQPDEGSAARQVCKVTNEPREPVQSYINARAYYGEFYGHQVAHLESVYASLSAAGCKRFIFLAGDSTLDNKYWLEETAPACNGYEHILRPPRMKKDVAYWLNRLAADRLGPLEVCTIMSSVEASTLADRKNFAEPLAQDAFVRDHLRPSDFVILSAGGNDIALRPTVATALNMVLATRSPAWLSRCGVWPGLGYLVRFFCDGFAAMLRQIAHPSLRARALVCMIYYPQERSDRKSWASLALRALGYDSDPSKLQLVIREVFEQGLQKLTVEGTRIVPIPLYTVLNASDGRDYEHRVEPSVEGGRKMATAFLDALLVQ